MTHTPSPVSSGKDLGVPASPSGSQASPEAPCSTGSSPSVSIPNAGDELCFECGFPLSIHGSFVCLDKRDERACRR